ncbi:MAG: hypothetical protein B7X85_04220, partial [Thiotrichales bacterium 17-46-47]
MKELFEKAGWGVKNPVKAVANIPTEAPKTPIKPLPQTQLRPPVTAKKHQKNLSSSIKRSLPLDKIRLDDSLPVVQRADEIVQCIQQHQVVVLAGETGSGKTTQLPKLAMLAGRGE